MAGNFELDIKTEDKEKAGQFLRINGIFPGEDFLVVLHPVSRWPAKAWPKVKYAKLCDRLISQKRAKIVIIGATEDRKEIEETMVLMKEKPAMAAGALSLLQSVALLKMSDLFIGNDAAPMHIAAALKIPVVALFGPTDPEIYGPYGEGHTVIRANMTCKCPSRKICSDPAHFCMDSISVDSVFNYAEKYIEEKIGVPRK